VQIICDGCFRDCQKLTEATFEDGSQLRVIGNQAFCCSGLRAICIPASVQIICDGCFRDCKNLERITFENDSLLREIEKNAFTNCPKLTVKR
jgi:hypothetical protein